MELRALTGGGRRGWCTSGIERQRVRGKAKHDEVKEIVEEIGEPRASLLVVTLPVTVFDWNVPPLLSRSIKTQ